MHRPLILLLVPTAALTALWACSSETGVRKGVPVLVEPPAGINFGEVNVGAVKEATWTMQNTGIGDLNIQTVDFSGTDDDELYLISVPDFVPANGTAELTVGYSPADEAEHGMTLTMTTDDPDHDVITMSIEGVGVTARLEISPESLWFGEVEWGDSYTQTTTLSSDGSGVLTISNLTFPNGEEVAYSWEFVNGAALPVDIEPGTALDLNITYAPILKDMQISGDLVIESNDIDQGYQAVQLYAGDNKGGSEPPEVEIVTPEWGTQWISGTPITLKARAIDPDDAPDTLAVFVTVDEITQPYIGIPDSSGDVVWTGGTTTLQIEGVEPGVHSIVVRATDNDGNEGEDEVEVQVDPDDEPITYKISGGESIFEYINVDDDLIISVNGVDVIFDDNHTSSAHAPVEFEAEKGDSIQIIATDSVACARSISDVYLHYGTNYSQLLIASESLSGDGGIGDCGGHPDYDPAAYDPPPFNFVDQEVFISIP